MHEAGDKVEHTLGLAISNRVNIVLARLEVGEVAGLVVDIKDLLAALVVEVSELLASRGTHGLFEVGVQTRPGSDALVSDTVLLVEALGLCRGLVLGIELLESGGEAGADTVLLVKSKSTLNGLVADGVAVGEVLSDDTRAGLVFLRDVVRRLVIGSRELAASELVERGGSGDVNLVRTKLGVVKEKSSLGGRLFFEGDGSRLDAVGSVGLGGDGDV
jgi:hypothetical protein